MPNFHVGDIDIKIHRLKPFSASLLIMELGGEDISDDLRSC